MPIISVAARGLDSAVNSVGMSPGFFCRRANFESAIPKLLLLLILGGTGELAAQTQDQGTSGTVSPTPAGGQNREDIVAVPDRPTFSTTSETVRKGVFEIEYGFELADGHQNINGLLKLGLLKNFEIRFANIPVTRDDGIAGFGDSGAGFKFRFLEEKRFVPAFSLLYTLTIPTATADLGIGEAGHTVGLLLGKDIGKHHLDFNEVVQWLPRPASGGFEHNYFTAIAYSHPIRGKLGFSEEVAGFSHTETTRAALTILQTLNYGISPRFVLDSGFYIAAMGDFPRATFFAGMTYAVGDLYRCLRHTNR